MTDILSFDAKAARALKETAFMDMVVEVLTEIRSEALAGITEMRYYYSTAAASDMVSELVSELISRGFVAQRHTYKGYIDISWNEKEEE